MHIFDVSVMRVECESQTSSSPYRFVARMRFMNRIKILKLTKYSQTSNTKRYKRRYKNLSNSSFP